MKPPNHLAATTIGPPPNHCRVCVSSCPQNPDLHQIYLGCGGSRSDPSWLWRISFR
ncbi:hypothetical protein Hanom_Chr12g01098871 [Helianthus anomalus]